MGVTKMICLRCHHRKFEYGHHPNFGNCCLCAKCRRYVVLSKVSPNEICDLYMSLIANEVQITGIHPYDIINKYWPFPVKNMKYAQLWQLWKTKAIELFGSNAVQKPTKPTTEQRTEYQLDIFEDQA
jgi:hypothetical protein